MAHITFLSQPHSTMSKAKSWESICTTYFLIAGISTVPLVYVAALVIYKIGKRSVLKFCNKYQMETDLNDSLPDRVYNPNQYKDNCGYVPIHNQPIQVQ